MFRHLKKEHEKCLENETALAEMKSQLEKVTLKYKDDIKCTN